MRIRGTWTVLGCLGLLFLSRLAAAGDALLPRPPELEPDVEFWIRVYTEISTNDGFLHDQRDLSKVYETLHFGPELPVHERAHRVEAERTRLQEILRHLATGAAPADAEEQKVRDLWGAEATRGQLAEAVDDVRFQLGQSDRFREGLIRAGAWQAHIAQVLARLGLPPEIAALPHVESSFDPAAHSKVGAAGLWQFMRSTGRRFLRIDSAVDERLDPFRETEAAAQLLSYDYRLLGSWPLAITAYNHGAEGMLRAREALDTDDIVRIVRDYHSPTFGFASRNFYVSFLAALSISEDPEKYFGALHRGAARSFVEVKLAASAPGSAVLKALAIDPDTLRELNPALRPAVWSGRRPIPAGYVIRLPGSDAQWTPALQAQRLEAARPREAARPAMVAAASPGPALSSVKLTVSAAPAVDIAADAAHAGAAAAQYYLVQGDDTVSSIAERTGVTVAKLMALNSIPGPDYLYGGERLRLAAGVPGVETANSPEAQDLAQQAVQEKEDEDRGWPLRAAPAGPGRCPRRRPRPRARSSRPESPSRRPPIRSTTRWPPTTASGWSRLKRWGITPTGSEPARRACARSITCAHAIRW
jgi:membrane-bound lytic murein transglycosylase D